MLLKSLYAVQRKSDGFMFPDAFRGHTHLEPVDPATNNIRMFPTQLGAQRAMKAYLKGKHNPDWEYEDGGRYTIGVASITPVHSRDPNNFHVVEIVPTVRIPSP